MRMDLCYKYYNSLVFLVIFITSFPIVYGLGNMDMDFTISTSSVQNLRSGDSEQLTGTVSNQNWGCGIACTWSTTQGESGSLPTISARDSYSFNFIVTAPSSGSSPTQIEITASCTAPGTFCGFSGSKSKFVSLFFSYCGDGNKDSGETCSNCQADAGCQSGYICQSGQCIQKCGNGVQDSGETCSSCPVDVKCQTGTRCEASQCVTYCGNYQKDAGETCSSCPTDVQCQSGYNCQSGQCVQEIRCGDGQCQASESCSSCPSDCGRCPPVCGDGVCEGAESCSSCSKDCGKCAPICGNGQCESSETCSSCSSDCGVCPKTSTPQTTPNEATSDKSIQQQGIQKDSTSLATTQEATKQSNQPTTTLTNLDNNKKSIIAILSIVVLGAIAWIAYKIISKRKTQNKNHHEGKEKHKLKHCTKCGSKLNTDDAYCEKCGKKL